MVDEDNAVKNIEIEWVCEKCTVHKQAMKDPTKVSCHFCFSSEGAFKKAQVPASPDCWAHIICSLVIPETFFEKGIYDVVKGTKDILPDKFKLKCKPIYFESLGDICEFRGGITVRCGKESCLE
jgi:hypothetical protein